MELLRTACNSLPQPGMMPPPNLAHGLVMDAWRFDPAAAIIMANRVIGAGNRAQALLRQWISEAANSAEAIAAVIAASIALAPVPVYGHPSNFRPDALPLPHHPFILSGDVPFLPAGAIEAGGAMLSPADFIEACFRHGTLRPSLLAPEDPIQAVIALIASPAWNALILPELSPMASRMVRLQAIRAAGGAPSFETATADDRQFEEWWQNDIRRRGAGPDSNS